MTDTPNLGLPQIAAAQAQKHVTHNEALAMLDGLVQLGVLSRTTAAPPTSPANGARYLIPSGATGSFAGKTNQIAFNDAGTWRYLVPKAGWIAFVVDETATLMHNGTGWVNLSATIGIVDQLSALGVGTASDATNKLAVKSPAALFTAPRVSAGGLGDMRVAIEKEAAAKTASLMFQTNYSGRAELGLTGDDNLHLKVSADGTAWTEAIQIDRSSGAVTFPAGASGISASALNLMALSNLGLSASVAGGALTLSLATAAGATPSAGSPVSIPFRSSTEATGTITQRSVASATTLVVPLNATLGFVNATAGRIWIVAFDDAGTVRLGVINCRNGTNIYPLAGYGVASSTAISSSATSSQVYYTGTAATAKAYTVLGYMEWSSGLTTAGTWAVAPTRIEIFREGVRLPGAMIQQAETLDVTTRTTTSTSMTSTSITAALTPSSAANLVRVTMMGGGDLSAQGNTIGFDVQRNGASLITALGLSRTYLASAVKQGTGAGVIPLGFSLSDRPQSISALTYTLMFVTTSGTATLGARDGGANTQPTLLRVEEIQS